MPRQKTRAATVDAFVVAAAKAEPADERISVQWADVDTLYFPAPHEGEPARQEWNPAPAIEVTAKGDDHNTTVIRDRAINLRDNLVRVCDGERLDRARELLNRAVAVALGKD